MDKRVKIAVDGSKLAQINPAGPEKAVLNLLNGLKSSNTNFTTFLPKNTPKAVIAQTNAVLLPTFLSFEQVSFSFRLLLDRPDVIFAPFHTAPFIASLFIPMVAFVHGFEYENDRKSRFVKMRLNLFLFVTCFLAKKIIVPSEQTKAHLLSKKWNIRDQKITVIHEGVGPEFYKRNALEVAEVTTKYKLLTPYILCVSTLQPRKNYGTVIHAFKKLAESINNLDLVIVGKRGWDYQEILNLPQELNINQKVFFLDYVPDDDLPALYSGAVAFVNASYEEGFGLSALEAAACNLPCVLSDIFAFRNLFGELAYFFDPKSADELVRKLKACLYNDNTELTNNAVKRIKQYSWGRASDRLCTLLTGFKRV